MLRLDRIEMLQGIGDQWKYIVLAVRETSPRTVKNSTNDDYYGKLAIFKSFKF